MIAIFGIAMIYAMCHAVFIISKHTKEVVGYEKVVLWVGVVSALLIVLNVALDN